MGSSNPPANERLRNPLCASVAPLQPRPATRPRVRGGRVAQASWVPVARLSRRRQRDSRRCAHKVKNNSGTSAESFGAGRKAQQLGGGEAVVPRKVGVGKGHVDARRAVDNRYEASSDGRVPLCGAAK